jgi:radical SAM superfamily enzyme YgiQ (UPF0313 family)
MSKRLLFLQLPRLDPDVTSPGENVMLAAACLGSALARDAEGRAWQVVPTPAAQDEADNAGLRAAVRALQPDVLAATCYLWNVERTLRVLALLKRDLPGVCVIVGGPEVALRHPLLYRARTPVDLAVVGEGEAVFPSILSAVRRGVTTDLDRVGWRHGRDWRWGTRARPVPPLADLVPPAGHAINQPDPHGMAYLETNRGCPLHCAFCCYNLRRRGWSSLPPAEVGQRIRILRRRGAREIRLVDPTFNAHPQFDAVVAAMAAANRDRRVVFFVELRAETLTDAQAQRLAAAGVAEAEVGVQSTDAAVLAAIHRPTSLARVARGIACLRRHGIRPTIDFMYGLPHQGLDDLTRSLDWLARFPDAHPQFLPTLLLPGTELRDRAAELGLKAQSLPPYRVLSTDRLRPRQLAAVEAQAVARLGAFDTPTRRFVGTRLPDLFAERVRADLGDPAWLPRAGGNRRAVMIADADLFSRRDELVALIARCIRHEPDMLWQFVLEPDTEEPLDLLDALIAAIRRLPGHWLDRLVSPPGTRRLAARRVMVHLPRGRRFAADWREAAEAILSGSFH